MRRISIIFLFTLISFAASAQLIGQAGENSVYKSRTLSILTDGTDQASTFAAAIAAIPAGSILDLERGKTYTIATKIIINKSITINGNGAKINFTGTSGIAISIRASNIKIDGLEVYSTYATDVPGNNLIGTELSTNTSFYSNITISNCNLHDYSSVAIMLRYCRNAKVIGCTIDNFPYGGVMFYSVIEGLVEKNDISDITALGTLEANAYGISINNLSTDSNTRDVIVKNNYVKRVPWEGIDTHAGESLTFENNYVQDCGVGIAVVGQAGRAANNIKVINNSIRSTDYTSSGISIAGTDGGLYYTQAIVTGNTLTGQHIRLQETRATIVDGNHIHKSGTNYGIYFSGENINTIVTKNEIVDVHSPGGGNTYAIFFDNNNNSAQISGNILSATSVSLTNKNRYGFSTAAGSTGCLAFIGKNDFSAATNEQYRATGQFASRFVTNDGTTTAHVTTSTTYVVAQTDRLVLYEYGTGGTTMTLPAINALNDKRELWVVNLSSGTLTTSLAMYTTTSLNSTNIAAGARVHLTYDNAAGKIWRD